MENLKLQGDFASNGARVNLGISLFQFEENGVTFIYSPGLDLTGYGKSESEAKESFEISVEEFFKYTMNKRTLDSELRRLGWEVKMAKKKSKFKAPDLSSLISKNDYLQDILNQKQFKKYDHEVSVPC
jgi:hypothetical protein